MSFPEKDPKPPPPPFAIGIAEALHAAFGPTHAGVKLVMAMTGAHPRTVKDWFAGRNGPNGEHLLRLARQSDAVLEAFLVMAGRGDILAAKKVVDARSALLRMVRLIDRLLGDHAG